MKRIHEMLRRSPMKTIPIVVVIICFISAINMYTNQLEGKELSKHKEVMKSQHHDLSWSMLKSYVELGNNAARQNSKFISKKLEVEILKEYKYDIDILQKEFEQNMLSQRFYDVLKSNLLDVNTSPSSIHPTPFYIMVGMNKGIIAIFSDLDDNIIESKENMISWEHFIRRSVNPEMTREAVNSILSGEKDIVIWQRRPFNQLSIQDFEDISLSTLRDIYEKEGIDGLKDFSILTASYITDNGDIFDTDDQTFMTTNENYKIVILQSFTLMDVIGPYLTNVKQIERISDQTSYNIDSYLSMKFIISILVSVLIFVIAVFFISIYNGSTNEPSFKRKRE